MLTHICICYFEIVFSIFIKHITISSERNTNICMTKYLLYNLRRHTAFYTPCSKCVPKAV